MTKLKEELQKSIRQMSDFDKLKNQIEMTITSEGLRIELLDRIGDFLRQREFQTQPEGN